MPNASGALKAYSDAEFLTNRKTTAELRAEIGEKITDLDLSFIVVMDDLDRLEPAQAVEIVRLVKSVADFPRFRYVLSYDKAVLAHAIQTGLGLMAPHKMQTGIAGYDLLRAPTKSKGPRLCLSHKFARSFSKNPFPIFMFIGVTP